MDTSLHTKYKIDFELVFILLNFTLSKLYFDSPSIIPFTKLFIYIS